uniref:Cytochrome b6/f complex subunit V n=1 Tax=Astrosyne radiata TaxID=1158023 RepID=A0A2U9NT17_9STRA|nr:cytochrome b6/f complex subunit V [Astrosyne radiata]AWT40280.1 cytochrome b6/f complex subunit V [Astrosyne radiata]
MVENLLSGIVLGMIIISAFGLFVTAFIQWQKYQ